jgi:hypothetical protein
LTLFGGVQRGRDRIATGGKFTSIGAFVAGEVPVINELTAVGARYDWFDPSRNKPNNLIQAITIYGNVWIKEQFRITAEYWHKRQDNGLDPDRKDNGVQLRLIYIK